MLALPEDAIALLRQFTDDSDRSQWGIGDVAAALVDELGGQYGKARVRQRIAVESGLAPETVRDREGCARFYPERVRALYPFTFHQFKAIKSARERWEEYADWAVASMDEYGGRTPPVAVIRAKIKGNGDDKKDPAWLKRWVRLVELAEMIITDRETDRQVRDTCQAMLERAKDRRILPG